MTLSALCGWDTGDRRQALGSRAALSTHQSVGGGPLSLLGDVGHVGEHDGEGDGKHAGYTDGREIPPAERTAVRRECSYTGASPRPDEHYVHTGAYIAGPFVEM